jgi:DNA-binding NarL/FixJ family response regulator
MPRRVLLADDHRIFREILRTFLESNGWPVVGEAADGLAVIEMARQLHPDTSILDFRMPGLNGIDAARELLKLEPRMNILLLTAYHEDHLVIEALRAGVRGYVTKTQATTDLLQAMRETSGGAIYLSPGVTRVVVDGCLGGGELSDDRLTLRERQVVQLVAEGRTNKEIAGILSLSTKTAESHRAHAMKKLAIHETAGLVRYAIRKGLIPP